MSLKYHKKLNLIGFCLNDFQSAKTFLKSFNVLRVYMEKVRFDIVFVSFVRDINITVDLDEG